MGDSKDNVYDHRHYDFENQKETFTPNPNFGKESKVKTAEEINTEAESRFIFGREQGCFINGANWVQEQLQSHITKLEAENAYLKDTLLNIRDRTVKQPVIYNIITKALENEI